MRRTITVVDEDKLWKLNRALVQVKRWTTLGRMDKADKWMQRSLEIFNEIKKDMVRAWTKQELYARN